jgi:DNA/RNA-binding domain of Phe-tRNA-synthetase-like protein
MTLTVTDEVGIISAPRGLLVHDVSVEPRTSSLDVAIAQAESTLRVPDVRRDAALSRTRAMYRAFGVDPTRTRPSSEALLRRVRKGERLPQVSNLVDIVNWCSVESQVPFGLYDLQRVDTHVTVRLGVTGEGYEGIRKDWVNVAGRLVVADTIGAFGNPTSDSARAMVTSNTRGVLVVLFFPAGVPDAEAHAVQGMTVDRFVAFAAGRVDHVPAAASLP